MWQNDVGERERVNGKEIGDRDGGVRVGKREG